MALLALERARARPRPDALAGALSFVSVIEEECTGNGTLAAARAGVLADAVLLPEPTGLELLLGGVGIVLVRRHGRGREPARTPTAGGRAVNPIEACAPG